MGQLFLCELLHRKPDLLVHRLFPVAVADLGTMPRSLSGMLQIDID